MDIPDEIRQLAPVIVEELEAFEQESGPFRDWHAALNPADQRIVTNCVLALVARVELRMAQEMLRALQQNQQPQPTATESTPTAPANAERASDDPPELVRPAHYQEYADIPEIVPGVFVLPGAGVYLVDDEGEVVMWEESEWEDPSAVTATVNACLLAAMWGTSAVRQNLSSRGKLLQHLIAYTNAKVRWGIDCFLPPGTRRWFEYHCEESHTSVDAQLWYHSHQEVTVGGCVNLHYGYLPQQERLDYGHQLVYLVKFDDGFEGEAFEDELLAGPEEFQRPAPPAESERPTHVT